MGKSREFVYGHSYKPQVFSAIEAVVEEKLKGKEYLRKRPKTSIRLRIDDHNSLTFKPEIDSTPTGWKMGDKIRAELRKDITLMEVNGHGCYLILNLMRDGSIKPRQWKRDPEKTKDAFDIVKSFLNKLADEPGQVIARNKDHCAICGRGFTDPNSKARGIGPECVKMFDVFLQKVHGGNIRKGKKNTFN